MPPHGYGHTYYQNNTQETVHHDTQKSSSSAFVIIGVACLSISLLLCLISCALLRVNRRRVPAPSPPPVPAKPEIPIITVIVQPNNVTSLAVIESDMDMSC